MANLYDYLDWRGDVSFEGSPLNEVDNLILSWLSYAQWDGVLPAPGEGEPLTLTDAAARFFALRSRPQDRSAAYSINPTVTAEVLLSRLASCPRFQGVRLCGFVNELDEKEEKQFAALTILCCDWAYISFRGTDTTFIGWKEDCCLSLSQAVPAQVAAVAYLTRVPETAQRRLYIGGHSKGGNLAVYAGVKCGPEIAGRVERIFNNDGPGFPQAFIEGEDYRRMLPRIHTIIPQSSVVGLLLEHREAHVVIKSAQISVLQHNGVNWEVLGPEFVREKELTSASQALDRTLKQWMATLDDDARRAFIEALFSLLSATGATRIEELGQEGLGGLIRALRALSDLGEEQKGMLLRAVLTLIKAGNATLYQAVTAPGAELLRQGQQKVRDLAERIREAIDKLLGPHEGEAPEKGP